MKNFFKGTMTAMITPFTQNGVNFDALEKTIEHQIKGGTDALLILGTTGEPATMTEKEKHDVITCANECINKRVQLIIGTGSNSTAHAVENSINAQKLGADGILVVTPYYNKCTQKGIVEYYKSVCSAVDIPVIAYNVPGRTGVNISPATAEALSYIPNMAGIKEACGNMSQICLTMSKVRERMDIFSGDDGLNLPIFAIGGAGCISVASNIAPKLVKDVYNYYSSGDMQGAIALTDRLLPFYNALFNEVNPIPVKAGMALLGFEVGSPRSPLTDIEDSNLTILKNCMKELNLL